MNNDTENPLLEGSPSAQTSVTVATVKPPRRRKAANAPESVLGMIDRAARDPSVDVAKMQQLIDMRNSVMAQEAEKAFVEALSAAQSEMTAVTARTPNKQTGSKYASYSALDKMARPIYTKHGFSLSFNTETLGATSPTVRIVCYVSHTLGHTRTYHIDMPADGKGAKGGAVMTLTHATGSATSYGMRYLLKMIFNIAVAVDEDDDDGNAAGRGAAQQADDFDPAWLEAIAAATTRSQLGYIRRDMLETWGSAQAVPRKLADAYNARRKEVQESSTNV